MNRLILLATLALPSWLAAQGGFENTGSVTVGYRFTDVAGYEPKFQELFDLTSGPRLLDFSLFGKSATGETRWADGYSLNVSGVGGEPYTSVQAGIRKSNRYDLRITFRQSHYYWDRNDGAALPSSLDGLTNNHNWATVRKLGAINLLIHASEHLRFSVNYSRNTRDGITFTTRSLDYFGSSSTWGSFARANPYYLIAPLSEEQNRVTGGVDYTLGGCTLHYHGGFQRFTDRIDAGNGALPERSINIDDPSTSKETASNILWSDSRRLSTPVSEFSYTGKLHPGFEARGGYLFYRYRGPATLDAAFDGIARSNSTATTLGPYSVSVRSSAQNIEPNHVIDQGFTYQAAEWWSLLADYRYSRFTVDSVGTFQSVAGAVIAAGESSSQWRVGTSTLDFNMLFTPASSLLIRAGVRLMKNDIEALEDHLVDPARTRRIKTVWPTASFYYQPSKILTIRADVEQINNGAFYTRVSPHIDAGGRVIARLRPTEKFYLEEAAMVRNRRLLATDYRSTLRSNAVTANYDLAARFSVFAGFSYDSFFAEDFVNFLRGSGPLTNLALRDQTVSRIWQGGLRVEPLRGFGIHFTGNYVRSNGLGEIDGEAPLCGPLSFPYATASLYYDVPLLGRMTAQFQRTYYTEEIVPGNNFSANLLTLAFTRSF